MVWLPQGTLVHRTRLAISNMLGLGLLFWPKALHDTMPGWYLLSEIKFQPLCGEALGDFHHLVNDEPSTHDQKAISISGLSHIFSCYAESSSFSLVESKNNWSHVSLYGPSRIRIILDILHICVFFSLLIAIEAPKPLSKPISSQGASCSLPSLLGFYDSWCETRKDGVPKTKEQHHWISPLRSINLHHPIGSVISSHMAIQTKPLVFAMRICCRNCGVVRAVRENAAALCSSADRPSSQGSIGKALRRGDEGGSMVLYPRYKHSYTIWLFKIAMEIHFVNGSL